jgi:glycogen synthase
VRTLSDGYVYHKFLASHLRTPTRSLRDRFSVLKNRVYFAFKHGSATLSAFDICRDLTTFVQHQRNDFRWNVDHGHLTPQDFERFEADVHRAFDVGFARYRAKQERTRSADWFAVRQTGFLPFVTRRPAAEKLHLCFLSLEYPPGPINGIARFTHEMAVGLAELGHHVHVLTLGEHHNRVDLEDGVWVHRIVPTVRKRPANPIVPQDNWNYSASLHEEVLRIHRHRALDLVESPIWDSEGIATLLDGEVPVIVSLHTPLPVALEINPHWGADPTVRESRIEPLVALERFCLEHCEAILANSEAIVAEIESGHRLTLDRTRLRVVPHGFGASTVGGPTSPDMKKGLNVLFVGRLERRKGIDTLLEAIPVLLERFPEMNFTIVGDDTIPTAEGPTYREAFQARADTTKIAERVTFTGRVGDPHLAAFYAVCDIFVAPSRYESFGLIFIEAMAHGKPVIGCDAGGMREVIAPGENGLLVPPGDAQSLADAIALLAADADLRGRMSARAREIYEGRFTRRIMAEAAEDFYRDFVARRTLRRGSLRQIEAA